MISSAQSVSCLCCGGPL